MPSSQATPKSAGTARKRPVNLTLNVGLVAEAKALSPNLSATVESLLAVYVADERKARRQRQRLAEQCADDWNRVLDTQGSFADAHQTF